MPAIACLEDLVKTKQKIAGSIVDSLTPQLTNSGQTFLSMLSFTHFAELLEIQDSLKRVFCEVECIRGNWSVREEQRPPDLIWDY